MRKLLLILSICILTFQVEGQSPIRANPFARAMASCTFPQILTGTSQGHDTDNATSRVITLPTGTSAGDLVLVFMVCDGVDATDLATTSSGWTVENRTSYVDGNMTSAILWLIADGTDALTVTSTSERAAWICYRISCYDAADPITVTNTAGAKTTNYDPPANTGVGGALNYTWFVFASSQNNPQVVASAAPTDFGNLLTETAAAVSQPSVSVARREYNTGAAYNPGVFTAGEAWYLAFTVIVNPQ